MLNCVIVRQSKEVRIAGSVHPIEAQTPIQAYPVTQFENLNGETGGKNIFNKLKLKFQILHDPRIEEEEPVKKQDPVDVDSNEDSNESEGKESTDEGESNDENGGASEEKEEVKKKGGRPKKNE